MELLPRKSKLEVVLERDDFWLKGNASSRGSISVVFKLSLAELLLVMQCWTNWYLAAARSRLSAGSRG